MSAEKKLKRNQVDYGSYNKAYRQANKKRIKAVRRKKGIILAIGITGIASALASVFWKYEAKRNQSSEVGLYTYICQQDRETELEKDVGILPVQDERMQDTLLLLVNKTHKIPEGYEPELHWLNNGRCAVAEEMYDALSEMLTDGSDEGREFVVASGYRSQEMQEELLQEDIMADMLNLGFSYQEAYEKEIRETMPPGYSEHETGLAVDIVSLDYQILDEQQEWTEENRWLREHCSDYGFILRYPRGKEDITEVDYESWHFRYVGKEAAKEITEQGITLEEYVGK